MRRTGPVRLSDFCGCSELVYCDLHAPEVPEYYEELCINPDRIVRQSEGHVYLYLDEAECQQVSACGLSLERLGESDEPETAYSPYPEPEMPEVTAPRLSLTNSPRFSSETEEEADIEEISSASSSEASSRGSYQSLEDFIDFRPEFNSSGAFDFEGQGALSSKLDRFEAGATQRWFADFTNENLGRRLHGDDLNRKIKKPKF